MADPEKLACGWTHTLLLTDFNELWGWGVGENGELGSKEGMDGIQVTDLTRQIPELTADKPVQVAVGARHTLILTNDKQVVAMGSTDDGRLGIPDNHGVVTTFPGDEPEIASIAAGTDFSMAIGGRDRSVVYAWGLGKFGNLGDGARESRDTPVMVRLIEPRTGTVLSVAQVSCGSRHTLAVCAHGQVFAWGFGANGRLGLGKQEDRLVPTLVEAFMLSKDQRVVQVAAGDSHSMARGRDGRVYTWGSGSYGRLGLGSETDQYMPKVVERLRKYQVLGIACGAFHSLAIVEPLRKSSSLFVWGGGRYGKLGTGSCDNALSPVEVEAFRKASRRVVNAKCGLHHTVAITAAGVVYVWGYAANHRLGFLPRGKDFHRLPERLSQLQNVKVVNKLRSDDNAAKVEGERRPHGSVVVTGLSHTVAIADGRLYAWGDNSHGQLGTGFHKHSLRPILVDIPRMRQPTVVVAVAAGGFHTLCVASTLSVYTWGCNDSGQLGQGDKITRAEPTLVQALQGSRIRAVAAGTRFSAAVAWLPAASAGSDAKKAGGDGDRGGKASSSSSSSSPGGDEPAYTSRIYVWGSNSHGQLGLGPAKVKEDQIYPAPLPLPVWYHEMHIALGHQHSVILGINYHPKKETKYITLGGQRLSSEPGGSAPNPAELMVDIKESHVYTCGDGENGQLGRLMETSLDRDRTWEPSPRLVTNWNKQRDRYVEAGGGGSDGGGNGRARVMLPKVKMVAAGATCTMAVVLEEKLEELYSFGEVPGLDPLKTSEPRLVNELNVENIRTSLALVTPVQRLSFDMIWCAINHFIVLLRYNSDRRVVFTWGETKYGKLGVGNVAKYKIEKQKKEEEQKKRTELSLMDDSGDSGSAISNVLGPSPLRILDDKEITCVSCNGDHTLAASEKSGMVYAWGYGSGGRLGIAKDDESANRSVDTPKELNFFTHSRGALDEDEDGQGADTAGGAAVEDEDDEDEEETRQMLARQGSTSEQERFGVSHVIPDEGEEDYAAEVNDEARDGGSSVAGGFGGPGGAGAQSDTAGGDDATSTAGRSATLGGGRGGGGGGGGGGRGPSALRRDGTRTTFRSGGGGGGIANSLDGDDADGGDTMTYASDAFGGGRDTGAQKTRRGGRGGRAGGGGGGDAGGGGAGDDDMGGDDADGPEDARAMADEDEEDAKIQKAINPKSLPKERFQVIKLASNLLERKKADYSKSMNAYLSAMDQRLHAEDICDLAVRERIREVSEKNFRYRDYKRQRAERLRMGRWVPLLADDEFKMGESSVGVQDLDRLEETVSRMHMAPCLLIDLYSNCSQFITSDELFAEGADALKHDFTELMFSLYDLHHAQNQRLMSVVLQHMVRQHVRETPDNAKIMLPETLEYHVFERVLLSGRYRRPLVALLDKALQTVRTEALTESGSVDPAVELAETKLQRDTAKVVEQLNKVADLADALLTELTSSLLSSIMEVVSWLVEIVAEAFKVQNREDKGIIGRRLVRALAALGIDELMAREKASARVMLMSRAGEDLDAAANAAAPSVDARSKSDMEMDENPLGGDKAREEEQAHRFQDRGKTGAIVTLEVALLHVLLGYEEAKSYLSENFDVELAHVANSALLNFWKQTVPPERLNAFRTYAETKRKRDTKSSKKGASAETGLSDREEENRRAVLRDYLLARTVWRRRVLQLGHNCRKLLIAFGYFKLLDDEDDLVWTSGTVNMRLDVFNTDKHEATILCPRCNVWHPPVKYPKLDVSSKDQKVFLDDSGGGDGDDAKKKIVIPLQVCLEMWRTAQEEEFRTVVHTLVGEGAWKEIMRLLKVKRQQAFEKKNHDASERYEETTRYMRIIKEAKPGTAVFLASESRQAVKEILDPARLFETLRQIDAESEREQETALRNVELFVDVVRALHHEARAAARQTQEVQQAFKQVTGTDIDLTLSEFKHDQKSSARGQVRSLERISVYKERGHVKRYMHQELYNLRILGDDDDKSNRAQAFCCLPITWCFFLRTSPHTRNQILFYDKLEFIFLTTDSDDVFELKVVFEGQLLTFALVSLALLVRDNSVRDKVQEEKQRLARARGIPDDCHRVVYDPQGDRVPVTKKQTFVFDRFALYTELNKYPRPIQRTGGEQTAMVRAEKLAMALEVR